MILTNILLAILVAFKVKKYIQNNYDFCKKPPETPPPPINKEGLDELDAHKVFTTKSLGELHTDISNLRKDLDGALKPAIKTLIKNKTQKETYPQFIDKHYKKDKVWKDKEWEKLSAMIKPRKKNKGQFTDFQIRKEIFRSLSKKFKGLKTIKNIEQYTLDMQTESKKAYHRLMQRKSYANKKNK